jgi:hypothetical protein
MLLLKVDNGSTVNEKDSSNKVSQKRVSGSQVDSHQTIFAYRLGLAILHSERIGRHPSQRRGRFQGLLMDLSQVLAIWIKRRLLVAFKESLSLGQFVGEA